MRQIDVERLLGDERNRMARYLTEYNNASDGHAVYSGPQIVADCIDAAVAIVESCVKGPSGETLRVIGELVETINEDGSPTAYSFPAAPMRPS